jgi:hypothetical protein
MGQNTRMQGETLRILLSDNQQHTEGSLNLVSPPELNYPRLRVWGTIFSVRQVESLLRSSTRMCG